MTNEKIFIGNTKTKKFENGGEIIRLGLPVEDIKKHIKNGWLNLNICKRKGAVGDEKDYYTCIDTYEPTKSPADSMRTGMAANNFPTEPTVNQNLPEDDINCETIPF